MVVGFIRIIAYSVLSLNSMDKSQIAIKQTFHFDGKATTHSMPVFQISYFGKSALKKLRVSMILRKQLIPSSSAREPVMQKDTHVPVSCVMSVNHDLC